MKVTGMRLKRDFLAEVFVLWSMGNELVLSPLNPRAQSQIQQKISQNGNKF